MSTPPELSIIVPVLNEEGTLPEMFATLAGQEGIHFELILCEGGSRDGTLDLARNLGKEVPFRVNIITTTWGRAKQMNAGAAATRGETLLFLHADSRFNDPSALRTALDVLNGEIAISGNERTAGRFSIRFDQDSAPPSLAYYFYESKARMERRECTHGDQGFMLRRSFFREVGPFDATYPMLAETRLAEAVRLKGKWLLFPAEIVTSARRFEKDGLYERQVLNAITMNFACQGWDAFFEELPGIYPPHSPGGRLPLTAMLREIDSLIATLPFKRRLSLWYETGRYVRSHAWQIPFFLDMRRNFRRSLPPGRGSTRLLAIHDRYFDRFTDHPPGRFAAALLTWLWFRISRIHLRTRP